MWSIKWWKDVGERAIRTFASSLLAWITVAGNVNGFEDLNWLRGLSLSGIATLMSLLMSIGTHGVTGNGPSFTSVYKEDPEITTPILNGKHVRGNNDNPRN
jgi:hypothetical protein